MATTNDGQTVLQREAQAEEEQRRVVAESERGLSNRCPECGALGSLEEIEGETRCVDCDVAIAVASKLGGLGRK